jgi:hypothetical protein
MGTEQCSENQKIPTVLIALAHSCINCLEFAATSSVRPGTLMENRQFVDFELPVFSEPGG